MFPSPLDVPASVDCVALASTGVDATLPLLLGLIAVAVGTAVFAVSRGRMRRGGVALGLVLLLAAGGGGLALTAPATSASADSCTPLDYSIDAELESPESIDSGDAVVTEFWITNVADRDGTPPIVVSIPKLEIASSPVLLDGDNWTLDAASSSDAYLFTYSGPLPKDTVSSIAVFSFALSTVDTDVVDYEFPVSIVTGSGGDTNIANNSVTLAVEVDGVVDFALSGTISPTSTELAPVASGSSVQVDLNITNTLSIDSSSPLLVRMPGQTGITNMVLGGSSTGWTLEYVHPYYELTYTPVLAGGAVSSTATLTFTANNGNSSTVNMTLFPALAIESGGSDGSNDSVDLPLWVGGIVG